MTREASLGPSIVHRLSLGVAAAAAALAASSEAAAGGGAPSYGEYQVVQSTTSHPTKKLVRTESTVQVGDDPINRFQVVRVRKKGVPAHAMKGTLLLLPAISNGFPNYEVTADGNYKRSFAAFFARKGYDVWGVSLRTEGLAAGACESGAVDCDAMEGWGLQSLLDDAGFVRAWITAVHPGENPAVGGVSLGSMAATALIDAHPGDYAGAFLLDGALYDANPAHQAIAAGFCATFEDALAQGVYYDAQVLPGIRLLAGLATTDPHAPSPIPGFPSGYTNHQVFVAAMSEPGIGPLTPRPGYAILAGDAAADEFTHADDALVRANVATFLDYAPTRMIRDIDCALAGETTFTGNLASYTGPVLVNGGGLGFGPAMLDTAALMTGADLTIHFKEHHGHMDQFFAHNHRKLTEKAILKWLEKDVFCP